MLLAELTIGVERNRQGRYSVHCQSERQLHTYCIQKMLQSTKTLTEHSCGVTYLSLDATEHLCTCSCVDVSVEMLTVAHFSIDPLACRRLGPVMRTACVKYSPNSA